MPAFLNSYKEPESLPAQDYHVDTPASAYDVNFCLDAPEELSTPGGVILVPLIPSLHAHALLAQLSSSPSIYRYLPLPTLDSLTAVLTFLEVFRRDPTRLLFGIFDQSLLPESSPTAPSRLAGIIGVLKTDTSARSTEIGPVIIFPDFQRSHVMTHAAALVLRWTFDDLRLRRVQWFAHAGNTASVKGGERLGLKVEGQLRWERVLALGKEGVDLPEWATTDEAAAGRGPGRHSVLLAIGWDEWREQGKGRIATLVEREVKQRTLARSTPVA